jgi:pimeloyl-ACP methyl ester carboxylesterase
MAPYRGARITVPACFVAGDRDLVIAFNQEIYAGMPSEVPDLRTNLLLPGCGHWTQQERPDETNKAMLEFLADVTA